MISSAFRLSRGTLLLVGATVAVGAGGIFSWFMITADAPRIPNIMSHELPSELYHGDYAVEAALDAPLFWESRAPVLVPEPGVENTYETLEGVTLVGVVENTVLLKKADVVRRVSLGSKFDGFTLESIESGKIVLVSPDRKVELKILKDPPASLVLEPLS